LILTDRAGTTWGF